MPADARAMKFDHLAILLTCHSLEDFPVHHAGEEADSLLANWTALWHPRLIADAGRLPTWIRTYDVPENCAHHLFLSPLTSDHDLQTGFAQRVETENGRLIRRQTCRDEILKQIFDEGLREDIDAEKVLDFFALGYCYLQIQLLTRQLRYSSNLDEVYFSSLVIAAAEAAVANDLSTTDDKLQAAFDLLMEERDNYYPVNALLIDLTLVADTTLGPALGRQLESSTIHGNYLLSGVTAEKLAENPQTATALKSAIHQGQASVVGGSYQEPRFPLMPLESILDDLRQARQTYRLTLDTAVHFFGRRRYGLCPSLPQILEHFQFRGAFHFTLDDGRFPEGMQLKSFWEGDGNARIEVFGKVPLDANAPGNFLNLGVKIGESFDMDHAAAICFVHWPGQNSVWYEDLKRIRKFGSVLGDFVSATRFLEETEEPYQHDRFTPDQYQSPYLKQAISRQQADPISRTVRYWKRTLMFDSIRTLRFLRRILSSGQEAIPAVPLSELTRDWESLDPPNEQLDIQLAEQERLAAQQLAESLTGGAAAIPDSVTETPTWPQTIVFNPTSLVQRSSVAVNRDIKPAVEKPIYATSEIPGDPGKAKPEPGPGSRQVVIDVPSLGYASIVSGASPEPPKKSVALIDELVLRNEFIEVVIDPGTGGIRAIHDYQSRGNRMSQILACRAPLPGESGRFGYSRMKLDKVETLINTHALGRIRTTGQLLFADQPVAEYRQTMTLFRGSRVVEVDVDWIGLETPTGDPWNWYFGPRFAYGDESSNLSTTVNQTRQPVFNNRIEAPHYIDLETIKSRTSILTGGVPFHVRRGDRYIDSIQIVSGESARHFRFGIGVDLPNPLFHAQALLKSPLVVAVEKLPQPTSSWLFHLDSKNILATAWEPIPDQEPAAGFRVRLLETMGRATRCKLSSFKPLQSANQIRDDGEVVMQLPIDDGRVELNLAANQFLEIEARW